MFIIAIIWTLEFSASSSYLYVAMTFIFHAYKEWAFKGKISWSSKASLIWPHLSHLNLAYFLELVLAPATLIMPLTPRYIAHHPSLALSQLILFLCSICSLPHCLAQPYQDHHTWWMPKNPKTSFVSWPKNPWLIFTFHAALILHSLRVLLSCIFIPRPPPLR